MVQFLPQFPRMLTGFLSLFPGSPSSPNRRVLNDPSSFPPSIPPSPSSSSAPSKDITITTLAQNLRKETRRWQSLFLSADGKTMDYSSLLKSEDFVSYLHLTTLLASVQGIASLSLNEKKATFLNLYNCLVIHAIALDSSPASSSSSSLPSSALSRTPFFANTCYNVSGHILSLDDIEHGLLRGNRRSPNFLARRPLLSTRHFPDMPSLPPSSSSTASEATAAATASSSSLASWILPLDPRIHFALNCGALSCPAIRFYEGGREGGREGGKEGGVGVSGKGGGGLGREGEKGPSEEGEGGGKKRGFLGLMEGGVERGVDILDEQLDAAARTFFAGVNVEREGGREGGKGRERIAVYVSKICDWYKSDFAEGEGGGGGEEERMLRRVVQWFPEEARREVEGGRAGGREVKVKYLPYDWGVNVKR